MLADGDVKGLNDTHFPTIDPKNPHLLTSEEKAVIDDLEKQFKTIKSLKS